MSPACLSSSDPSSLCLPADSVVGRLWRLENLAPRHQLHVLCRQRPGRLRLFAIDRLLWVLLYRLWPRCLEAMLLVKPATVIQWHRQGFRLFWRWRSRSGRPSVEREIRDLIRQMSSANPLWGAPRIHGELLKLGIEIGQATVAKYMVRRRGALPRPGAPSCGITRKASLPSTCSSWRPYRAPTPKQAESLTVPLDHRCRLDQHFGCST